MNKETINTEISVIVCVHNALFDVQECLTSLLEKKTKDFELIIIDDGSDKKTKKFLEKFINKHSANLIRHKEAQGYTVCANKGLKEAKGEFIVLLNSDTVITRYWLESLIECMNTTSKTGIVGPLSNSAGWQSIPYMKNWISQKLPDEIDLETMSRIVNNASNKKFPIVPLINGFCFMIRREVLDTIGYLDEKNFPIGYGEEDDYCIRAKQAGYEFRIADQCYIYHKKSKSFTHERRKKISKRAGQILRKKHGNDLVNEYIKIMKNNKELLSFRENIVSKLNEYKKSKVICNEGD